MAGEIWRMRKTHPKAFWTLMGQILIIVMGLLSFLVAFV